MEEQRENGKKIRVAMYCRMATDNDENRGLEIQKSQLRNYAQEQGYAVIAEVSEVAKGLSLDRPGIRELLSLAAQNRIEEILVANLSRISRNTGDLLRFEEKLGKQHIRLNTPQGNPLAGFRGIERPSGGGRNKAGMMKPAGSKSRSLRAFRRLHGIDKREQGLFLLVV